ncbi:hypothetical protein HK096_010582, partial [Nowakowskiella sp. JEL0078]
TTTIISSLTSPVLLSSPTPRSFSTFLTITTGSASSSNNTSSESGSIPVVPASIVSGAVAFGALGAAGYFWNKRSARTQMLDLAAQGEQNLTTARTNPLYETPENVFDNPLFEGGDTGDGDIADGMHNTQSA